MGWSSLTGALPQQRFTDVNEASQLHARHHDAMSTSSRAPLAFYPTYAYCAHPLYGACVPIIAATLAGLHQPSGVKGHLLALPCVQFLNADICDLGSGQALYFHLNHPLTHVSLAGLVVSVDELDSRWVLHLDDGSGALAEAVCSRASASESAIKENPVAGPGQMIRLGPPEWLGRSKSGLDVDMRGAVIGAVVRVEGGLTTFRDNMQVTVEKMEVLGDTAAEVEFWEEVSRAWESVLARPWALGEIEIKRLQERQTAEVRAKHGKRRKDDKMQSRKGPRDVEAPKEGAMKEGAIDAEDSDTDSLSESNDKGKKRTSSSRHPTSDEVESNHLDISTRRRKKQNTSSSRKASSICHLMSKVGALGSTQGGLRPSEPGKGVPTDVMRKAEVHAAWNGRELPSSEASSKASSKDTTVQVRNHKNALPRRDPDGRPSKRSVELPKRDQMALCQQDAKIPDSRDTSIDKESPICHKSRARKINEGGGSRRQRHPQASLDSQGAEDMSEEPPNPEAAARRRATLVRAAWAFCNDRR